MNHKEYLKEKLKAFNKEDIIITKHTLIRIVQRQIDEKEIIENIINPRRLEYAIQEKAISENEEKYDCYFGYSKTLCHRYIIVVTKKVIVVTAVKINRRWQIIAEKKMKTNQVRK